MGGDQLAVFQDVHAVVVGAPQAATEPGGILERKTLEHLTQHGPAGARPLPEAAAHVRYIDVVVISAGHGEEIHIGRKWYLLPASSIEVPDRADAANGIHVSARCTAEIEKEGLADRLNDLLAAATFKRLGNRDFA